MLFKAKLAFIFVRETILAYARVAAILALDLLIEVSLMAVLGTGIFFMVPMAEPNSLRVALTSYLKVFKDKIDPPNQGLSV